MKAAVERLGRLLPGAIRYDVIGWRIALVVTSRLRAEARRERFARFRRQEWLRRPYRPHSLFVAGRDGPLRNAAGLGVEAIKVALNAGTHGGYRTPRRG